MEVTDENAENRRGSVEQRGEDDTGRRTSNLQ